MELEFYLSFLDGGKCYDRFPELEEPAVSVRPTNRVSHPYSLTTWNSTVKDPSDQCIGQFSTQLRPKPHGLGNLRAMELFLLNWFWDKVLTSIICAVFLTRISRATTAYLQSVLNQETNDVAIENIRIACLKINGRSSTPATLALLRSEFVPSILQNRWQQVSRDPTSK